MRTAVLASIASVGLTLGCGGAPSRVEAPDWEPDNFADTILAKLDTNSDGSLNKSELAAAPGLAFGAKYIDADKNDAISHEDLVARFKLYKDMRLGIVSKSMQLAYRGRPLAGAKVQLVPEFFLEGVVEPASGEAYVDGVVMPMITGMDIPGMRVGYYRVVVDSPNFKIPAKYGSAETTPLGVEVSPVSEDAATYGTIQLVLHD